MGEQLIGGDVTGIGYPGSMAAAIEDAFSDLLQEIGEDRLSQDESQRAVRDRRRMFVAIARGVTRHLAENPGAFDVTDGEGQVCSVTVQRRAE